MMCVNVIVMCVNVMKPQIRLITGSFILYLRCSCVLKSLRLSHSLCFKSSVLHYRVRSRSREFNGKRKCRADLQNEKHARRHAGLEIVRCVGGASEARPRDRVCDAETPTRRSVCESIDFTGFESTRLPVHVLKGEDVGKGDFWCTL